MTNSKHLLSKQIRQGVVSHIIRYDLLRRQEFRDKFLSRIGPGHLDEFAGKRRRILWEVIVAGAEAYLTDRAMATSDFHLAAATSRTTAGRCLLTLKQLGIVHLQVDQSDRRRSLVSISAPFQDILDLYVDECFEEFEDLITTHHDRERHKAEMALEDSEVRWRSLAEESPDHVILIDTNFEIQFINHTMPGLTPEQVSGTQISSYLRDEDRQHVMNALEGVTSSRHPASFETSCVTADGEILFFESRVVARVVDDAVIGLTIHARNISDRKLMEQALKNSEARFREFATTSSDWLWEMDADNRYSYFSPSFDEHIGLRGEDVIGTSREDLYASVLTQVSENSLRHHWEISNIIAARQPWWDIEQEWMRPDGAMRTFLTSASPIRDTAGNFRGYRGVARDITERKRTEEALRESEERYRSLVELSPDAEIIITQDVIAFANGAATRLFAADESGQLTGMALETFILPEFAEYYAEGRRRMIDERSTAHHMRQQVRRLDGRRLDVEVSVSYLSWKGTDALHAIIRDTTKRRQLEAQLAQARKMEAIGHITGGVAHEFNNILMAIIATLELLEADLEGDEEHLDMIRTASQAARHGADVTGRLTAFGGRQSLAPKALDLADFACNAQALLKPTLGETIEISTNVRQPLGLPPENWSSPDVRIGLA